MSARQPRLHQAGAALGADALVVDCAIAGGAATYSHWLTAAPPPPALAADTATGVLLAAASDPARWLDPYATAWIDHLDADGVIAVALACEPALAREHALLLGAAEAGDLAAWSTERAFRAMVALHQAIAGAGADHASRSRWLADAPRLVAALGTLADAQDPARDAAAAQVRRAIARLERCDGFALALTPRLARVCWTARLGHPADSYLAIDQPDDLPPWALSASLPATVHQLLAMRTDAGWTYLLDAPRHSWAATVARPRVAWRDLAALARVLEAAERQRGSRTRWVARPAAGRVGFVCQLASVDHALAPAPSRLDPELVAGEVDAALADGAHAH